MTEQNLLRSVPFQLRDAGDGDAGDGLTLEGYAAVFDQPTRINSWEGCFNEIIARGAFKKSLSERTPVLQFDHGRHPMVGSIPLGSFEDLREDEQGLLVKARLHDNWLIQPVRDAIASNSVNGMSFRFGVVKDEWRTAAGKKVKDEDVQRLLWSADPDDPDSIMTRTVRELRCPELGPVVFPAYAGTTVDVRSQELINLLSDPQVRVEAARFLIGTPATSSETASAGSDEGRAATPAEEPREHSPAAVPCPSPEARARDLVMKGVLPHGKH